MATKSSATARVSSLSKETAAVLARHLAGIDLATIGKVKVLTHGIPVWEEIVVSVLPSSVEQADRLVSSLVARPAYTRFEVFPYGILNPEIGRIDVRISNVG